jgi:hypothetical protein
MLNPFSLLLNPFPPSSPTQPLRPGNPAPPAQQPRRPRSPARAPATSRPSWPSSRCRPASPALTAPQPMTGGPRLSSLTRGRAGLKEESDPRRAAESGWSTPPPRGAHAKEPPPGLFKARRHPLDLPPEPPEPSRHLAPLPETLAAPPFSVFAAAVASSSRSSTRDAQGGEESAGVTCRHLRAP